MISRRGTTAGLGLAILTCALAAPTATAQLPGLTPTPTPTPTPPAPNPPVLDAVPADDSVTALDGNAYHDRAVASTLTGPLGVAWTARMGPVEQLLAVPGSLVAVTRDSLTSFDPVSGTKRWTTAVANSSGDAAIVGDVVVVATPDDLVALALADGSQRWTAAKTGGSDAAPVPAGDLILVQPDSVELQAFDVATGTRRWQGPATKGGVPAVVGDRVYVAVCRGYYLVIDRPSGRIIHNKSGACSGGRTVMRATGRTISAPDGLAFDASTYAERQVPVWYAARPGLALGGGAADVHAFDPATGATKWRARTGLGFGQLSLAGTTPVLVDNAGVQLLDGATGRTTWSARFAGYTNDSTKSIAALGSLFVWRAGNLIALRPGANGRQPTLRATIRRFQTIPYGQRVRISGTARDRPLLVKRAVRLTERRLRKGVRTRTITTTSISNDGAFRFSLKPDRYTRYNLRVAGARGSKSFAVIVTPRERVRYSRGASDPNAITARVRITVPPDVRIAGRTYALYVGRAGAKRYTRVAATRIRRSGRGRGTATLRFRAIHFGRRDFLRSCISGVSARGLNFNDRLDRACGARSSRF